MAVWSEVKFQELTPDLRLDADYYRPEYLEQENRVKRGPYKLLHEIAMISDGNHLSISDDFATEGVRYLRGQDLQEFFITDTSPIYIPTSEYHKLKRSHMNSGDVLIGIVGTIGSVGLVTDRFQELTGSCKLAILRPQGIASEYLAAYLASKVGQWEMVRRIRGAVQMGLILPDLRTLPVPLLKETTQEEISALVRASYSKQEEAKSLYKQAEALLIESLGLKDLNLSPSLFCERPYHDLVTARRADAEYFQPAKWKALDKLRKMGGKPLHEHFKSCRYLFQPEKTESTLLVRNYDLNHALQPYLDDQHPVTPAAEIGSTKKRLRSGDLVVSRLRSYLKEIAIVPTTDHALCVGSTEFIVLRPKPGAINIETALVFLRSPVVQSILHWSQDGSNHPRFAETELLNIILPDRLIDIQDYIAQPLRESEQARVESRRLLEEAKRAVETAIAPTLDA